MKKTQARVLNQTSENGFKEVWIKEGECMNVCK
jgi:hypothetical protein